uniref:TAFH domain-containing protein n=1 Tax=Panagrolaimus sp. PS1159 TaxID=55785 RepID=A0AC35GTT5_9BILA
MTTKDKSLNDNQQSFLNGSFQTDNSIQYSNLKLNQNRKSLIPHSVQSYSKFNKDQFCDYTLSDNFEEKGKSQAWNKSSDLYLNILKINVKSNKEEVEKRWKKESSDTDNSTLSLNITAYENSTVSNQFNGKNVEDLGKEIFGTTKLILSASTLLIQNPFEFPRQQNNTVPQPEVSQFKASQRLATPTKVSATSTNMEGEFLGTPSSILRPPPASPAVINPKFVNFFNELNKLASLKSDSASASHNLKTDIQELLNKQISPETFVARLQNIYGSYQPSLLHFLKSEPATSYPSVSTKDVSTASVETPVKNEKSPAVLVSELKVEPKQESSLNEEKPSSLESASSQTTESPLKPVYVEPDDPLLNASELLNYCNQRKNFFESFTQEAANCMGEFVNVEFRIFLNRVIDAAKLRQCTPYVDEKNEERNDIKKQLSVLDSHYLHTDLKSSQSEEAQKKLLALKNRSKLIEVQNVANETALAALGTKKRNWATSLVDSKPQPKDPYDKPFRITAADVAFAMQENKKLMNSCVYRNTLFLNSVTSASVATKFV